MSKTPDLGLAICLVRKANGLSQGQLASRLRTHRQKPKFSVAIQEKPQPTSATTFTATTRNAKTASGPSLAPLYEDCLAVTSLPPKKPSASEKRGKREAA